MPRHVQVVILSLCGGRHSTGSGSLSGWHINCWLRDKLSDDLNSQPKRPGDHWLSDLESGVRVTCDMGYLCANFSLPGLSVLDLGPMYATDRQTDAHHRLMPPALGGREHNNIGDRTETWRTPDVITNILDLLERNKWWWWWYYAVVTSKLMEST